MNDISPSAESIFDKAFQLTAEDIDFIYSEYEKEKAVTPGSPPFPRHVLLDLERRIQIRTLLNHIAVLRRMLSASNDELSAIKREQALRGK